MNGVQVVESVEYFKDKVHGFAPVFTRKVQSLSARNAEYRKDVLNDGWRRLRTVFTLASHENHDTRRLLKVKVCLECFYVIPTGTFAAGRLTSNSFCSDICQTSRPQELMVRSELSLAGRLTPDSFLSSFSANSLHKQRVCAGGRACAILSNLLDSLDVGS